MVTLGIFSFLGFGTASSGLIVTNDTSLRVIEVDLSYFAARPAQWGPLMAASTFTIVPLVVMYFGPAAVRQVEPYRA